MLTSNDRRYRYAGDTGATAFTGPRALQASDLAVYLFDKTTLETTTLTYTTDWTVSGIGVANRNTVVSLVAGPIDDSNITLVILRTVAYQQSTRLTNEGAYLPENVEGMGDYIVMQAQQLGDRLGRALCPPDSFGTAFNGTLPILLPGSLICLNGDASGFSLADPADVLTDLTTSGTLTDSGAFPAIPKMRETAVLGVAINAVGQALANRTAQLNEQLAGTYNFIQMVTETLGAAVAASILDYTCTTDLTSALQAAVYHAATNGLKLVLPPGLIPITTLNILFDDVLLTSLNHIHIEGAGSGRVTDAADYKGTVLVQVAGTIAPMLKMWGDFGTAKFLRDVRVSGMSFVGAAANTGWLIDTKTISGHGSVFSDINIYVRHLAGSGFVGDGNWAIIYQNIRVDGVGNGTGTATGTGFALYGSNATGVTNQSVCMNVQVSKMGRGVQLGHYDEASVSGTTRNIIWFCGQADTCDVAGLLVGFLQNSQVISMHNEQCYGPGWLVGKATGLGMPRQLDFIGCTSLKNGTSGVYDFNVVEGMNVYVRNHNFDQCDLALTYTSGSSLDNLWLTGARFNPFNASGGGHATVAVNNAAANTSTRFYMDGEFFGASYDTAYSVAAQILRPRYQGGYNAALDADTAAFTVKLHKDQTVVRYVGYATPVTLTTVVNEDGTPVRQDQRLLVTASNGNISIGNGVSFAIPCEVFTLVQNRQYEFIYEGGFFRFVHVPIIPVTALELSTKTSAVNTVDKSAGVERFNTTSGLPMWARGAVNTSDWVDSAGTVITPA